MTTVAQNVRSYRDVEIDREVVAIDLGHQHYLVLCAGGTSLCEVRRYRDHRLELNNASSLHGGVSLHRVKYLTQLVMRRANAGAEAVLRGVLPANWERKDKEPKQPSKQLLVDEDLMDKLRDDETFTAGVEAALRSAITHAQATQARAYVHDLNAAFNRAGLSGVKTNVAYMVLSMRSWKGAEAQRAKQLLNRWANK